MDSRGNPKSLYDFGHDSGKKRPVDISTAAGHDSRYSDNIVENAYVDELDNFFGVLEGAQQPRYSFEKDVETIALIEALEEA